MAKRSKGLFGAIGSLWRLTIMGLAIVLLFAIYLNVTGQNGEDTAAIEPVEPPVIEEETVAEATAEAVEEVEEATTETIAEPVTEAAAGDDGASTESGLFTDVMTVPGDDATYELLSAFRRDDGGIEITTTRTLEGATTQTTRLVTCAPLAVGTIAEGSGARNEAPEMIRISLGTAPAALAAAACGALR